MASSIKQGLANTFNSNYKINKKALRIKKSWDEVGKLIRADKKSKK